MTEDTDTAGTPDVPPRSQPIEGEPVPDGEPQRLKGQADEAERLREQVLHARADYANLQKRHAKDIQALREHALQAFVATLLPALDDLERALDAAADATDGDTLRAGVEMALGALKRALRDAGVEPVAAEGEPFNPAVHEALLVETDRALDTPTVAEEIRAGYTLGDRLVRPAQVKVAMPPQEAADDADDTPERDVDALEGAPDADV